MSRAHARPQRLYVTATVEAGAPEADVGFADTRAPVDWLLPVLRKPSPSVFNCRILDGGSTGRFAPAAPSAAGADEAAAQAAREAAAYEYPHSARRGGGQDVGQRAAARSA